MNIVRRHLLYAILKNRGYKVSSSILALLKNEYTLTTALNNTVQTIRIVYLNVNIYIWA